MANEQVHISRVSLWPFWVAARLFLGAFLIYFVSLVVVVFYASRLPENQQLPWAEGLISFYSSESKDPVFAEEMAAKLHYNIFIRTGIKQFATVKNETIFEKTKANIAKLPVLGLLERATYLFGIKLTHVILALPVFLALIAIMVFDGWMQRSIRKACSGHESASIYHRAKKFSFTLMPPLMASIYLASPWAFNSILIFLPCIVFTAYLVRLQAVYYKKYF